MDEERRIYARTDLQRETRMAWRLGEPFKVGDRILVDEVEFPWLRVPWPGTIKQVGGDGNCWYVVLDPDPPLAGDKTPLGDGSISLTSADIANCRPL